MCLMNNIAILHSVMQIRDYLAYFIPKAAKKETNIIIILCVYW